MAPRKPAAAGAARQQPSREQPRQQPPPRQQQRQAPPQDDLHSAVNAFFDDEDAKIERVDVGALEAITKGEVEMQIDAAHKYPRQIKTFLENARTLVTMDKETAASCIYQLKRWDSRENREKIIAGPSVRLAEMAATTYRNLHTAARVLDIRDRDVIVQAQTWDLEANNRVGIEVTRGIMTSGKGGKTPRRFDDDMIRVTCMAAIAIARRNAVFTVIPRAFINNIYAAATDKATGADEGNLIEEVRRVCAWFVNKQKVPIERICAFFQVARWEEISKEDLTTLIGMGNAIKEGEKTAEDYFPTGTAAGPRPVAKSAALDELAKKGPRKSEPPPANDAAPTLTDEMVIDALVDADEAWGNMVPALQRALVETWTPEQKSQAHAWAITFVQTPEDQPPPEQPEFTFAPSADPEDDGR